MTTCEHKWISSEGKTASGVICAKCWDYTGPEKIRRDILGSQLVVGDIILFYSKRKGGMFPGRVLEFIKGDCMGIERGYFLRSGEVNFFRQPELTVELSTQVVKADSLKALVVA